jgi:hypothetical protein
MLANSGLGVPNLAALGAVRVTPELNIVGLLVVNAQTFYAPVLALQAAQNVDIALFDEGDQFYVADFDVQALPGQLLIQHFVDADQFYVPLFAAEAAQNISVALFNEGDQFYAPAFFGATTELEIVAGYYANPNDFHVPVFVVSDKEPVYNYPIGRGLYSDYGIRASLTHYKRRMIIGRR